MTQIEGESDCAWVERFEGVTGRPTVIFMHGTTPEVKAYSRNEGWLEPGG